MKKFYFTTLAILVTIFILDFPLLVMADDITSQVTVNNDPPAFAADGTCTGNYPCEATPRDDTSPVNVGTGTTFRATADEPNGEDYYLIVCKSDAFTEVNGGPPTCTGGAGDTICVSTATTDDSAATCNYNAIEGDDENQAWYAKVCDDNATDQACSASTQGNTGGAADEASPLAVNHAPYISALDNDAGIASANDPGTNVTWTLTAVDPDGIGGDTIDLHVCNTNSFDGSSCGDTELCSQTGQSSDPTCQYLIPAGTDDDASPYDAYAFLVDNHDFNPSISSSSAYYVANVAPTILSIETNGGGIITLTGGESATTSASFVATVQDNNGCSDLSAPTDYVLYRFGVSGSEACSGDVNNCYTGDSGDYKVVCDAGATCTGGTDVDIVYTCSADLQYHSDPTVANTPWSVRDWVSYFNIDDDDAAADTASASGVELNMLQALDSTNLDYGSMDAGTNDANLTDSNTITNTGNVALDAEVSSAAAMSDGGTETIAVNNQRADETSGTAWASAVVTLSGSGQEIEVDCTKTTVSASAETDAIYWGINIPSNQFPALYTGTTTVAAIYSEVGQGW